VDWEQEIDLRAYIGVLLKFKFWIVGLALVSAVVAFAISALISPIYEAKALIAIVAPRYALQFDERFAPLNAQPSFPYKAYPSLALSDEVLTTLIDEMSDTLPPERRTLSGLRNALTAENGADPTMVELTVRDGDPNRAAALVNRWAALFMARANEVYGRSAQELTFYEAQLAETQAALTEAEQALIAFQAQNEAPIVSTQLDNKRAALNDYLSVARSLRLVVQDARSLQERLRTQDAATQTSLSDELSSLLLQVDALNQSRLPIQLQISGQQGLGSKTVGEQIAFLESLIAVLENKQKVLEQEATILEPDILALQEKLERIQIDHDRLERTKAVARETYIVLARKVSESRIASQNALSSARLVSRASVNEKPVAPRKLLNTAIAGALGLMMGVVGVFGIEYWRQDQEQQPAPAA